MTYDIICMGVLGGVLGGLGYGISEWYLYVIVVVAYGIGLLAGRGLQ